MNVLTFKKHLLTKLLLSLMVASCCVTFNSCDTDELTGQPDYLGNSIYEQLQKEGNYSYTLRLIDDLDLTAVLSKTGSRTLFAADDDAYEEFFNNNPWGVKGYEDLTMAQKKLLLNSSMINNAYLIELLSNVSGNPPQKGQCMRRESSMSIYDSIAKMYPQEMPNTSYWSKLKNRREGVVMLRDNSTQPMIHFLPAYMQYNKITDADLAILTNGAANSTSEAWVNGKKVIERDIICKNGYLHKVNGVITSSDNMAQIVHNHSNLSTFSKLLDRFSAPYYDANASANYNRLNKTNDSVYVMRYFAMTGNTGYNSRTQTSSDPDGNAVNANLTFDPGWNHYMYTNTAGYDLHYDAGAMLAPTNDALERWWNADGKVLQDMYGTWENVPMKVLVKLINNNLISSFSETVPSKFNNIVDNTTKTPLKITTANVDSCFMGCNGVVYMTNKVFTPADYSSVSFPALVNTETMNVLYWAIEQLNFEPYLNSMDSYYSFIIPTNNAMLTYIDPCSFGTVNTIMWQFFYDQSKSAVSAHRYYYNIRTKTMGAQLADATAGGPQVLNRLEDILNNIIVIGNIEDGHTYYKTKSGGMLKVNNAGQVGLMTVAGGYQIETGDPLTVSTIYDESTNGNGKAYVVEGAIPVTSQRTTYSILQSDTAYSEFFNLLKGKSGLLSQAYTAKNYRSVDYNINLFDAYNYTIYVPTNAAIKALQTKGYLPTWQDYEALDADSLYHPSATQNITALKNAAKKVVSERIVNFLKYHIQDNSVMIGSEQIDTTKYETGVVNPANKRFYYTTINANNTSMTVKDFLGNVRNVVTKDGLYNNIGREYWISNKDNYEESEIYNASDVVVHLIDGALLYSNNQLTKWRSLINFGDGSTAKRSHKAKRR